MCLKTDKVDIRAGVNAILLAGGESSRFGRDKALISFSKGKLIEYIYDKLEANFKKVIVIGSPEKYSFLTKAEIREDIYQNKGPLAGIYTGLYYSESDYNFICGCDMPFLNKMYFDFLKKQIILSPDSEIIIAQFNGYLEPLAAVYQRSLLKRIEKRLIKNDLKIKSFYPESRKKIIKEEILKRCFRLDKLFFNLNNPEDQKRAASYLIEEVDRLDRV